MSSTICQALVRGDEITLTVAPRDGYGNATVFGPGAGVTVSAVGGSGSVESKFEDRGGPRAEATLHGALNAAGSYLLSAKVGGEPLAGYPRILQIVPGRAWQMLPAMSSTCSLNPQLPNETSSKGVTSGLCQPHHRHAF